MVGDTAVHPTVVLPTQDPAAIVHDQNIAPSQEPPRRQTKSAPTTPKRPRIKIAATNICNEDVPDVKASLERLKLKKMPDVSRRNLRTATSASAISTIRGQPFTVGNVSNGLIYLRFVLSQISSWGLSDNFLSRFFLLCFSFLEFYISTF